MVVEWAIVVAGCASIWPQRPLRFVAVTALKARFTELGCKNSLHRPFFALRIVIFRTLTAQLSTVLPGQVVELTSIAV